ncbi:chorismate synthase [Pseudoramibacter porci]|uniref:Chorismate synthase n=1 Tax=Pseudoramibacter porci TaxID=2606631 RepID=A0A7X2NFC8_9FIRM|nr:chorismate synthase [Pseudoramibacter porci]MSS19078.1 chorismate synthase [Pseudoramibacter porci]
MTSCWGQHIHLSLFGESHGPMIGAVIDGLPSGFSIDETQIAAEMTRRSASGKDLATPRKEADRVTIVSGFFNGKTTGTPLTGIIENSNTHSSDYEKTKNKMRPGHADYTAFLRYGGFQDYRGGGHFSGRLTAPMVFAGAVAKQILAQKVPALSVGSRIVQIGQVRDHSVLTPSDYAALTYADRTFPVVKRELQDAMIREITEARAQRDSVGGIVEGYITGVPGGLGSPIFDNVESRLASFLFAIPAVKGVSFGIGFDISGMRGSEANDAFRVKDGCVVTSTNHNGGINGGITNGMPIVFKVAFKPTPSIAQPQPTIDIAQHKNTEIEIHGRHDPCIVIRALPVVESAAALCLLDLMMEADGRHE